MAATESVGVSQGSTQKIVHTVCSVTHPLPPAPATRASISRRLWMLLLLRRTDAPSRRQSAEHCWRVRVRCALLLVRVSVCLGRVQREGVGARTGARGRGRRGVGAPAPIRGAGRRTWLARARPLSRAAPRSDLNRTAAGRRLSEPKALCDRIVLIATCCEAKSSKGAKECNTLRSGWDRPASARTAG